MTEIKLDTVKYSVPTNWDELTFKQVMAIEKIKRENLSDFENNQKLVSILTGIDYDLLNSYDTSLTVKVLASIDFLSEEAPQVDVTNHFDFKGETYFCTTFEKSIGMEWVLFNQIERMYEDEPESALPLKVALMYRKQGETVEDVDRDNGRLLQERATLFEELSATTVLSISSFFLQKLNIYRVASHLYSMAAQQHQEKLQQLLGIITASGGGKRSLRKWRTAFLKKTLSFTLTLIRFWNGWNGRLILTSDRRR
jgi:hypothetical protein